MRAATNQNNDDDLSCDGNNEVVNLYKRTCDIIQSSDANKENLTVLLTEVTKAKKSLSSSNLMVVRQSKTTLKCIIAQFTRLSEARDGLDGDSKDDNRNPAAKKAF